MPGRFTGHKTVHSGLVSFSHIGFVWHMQVWSSPSHLGLGLWVSVAKLVLMFSVPCVLPTSFHSCSLSVSFSSFDFPSCSIPPSLLFPLFSFSPSPLLFLFLTFLQNRALLLWEPADTPGKVLSSCVRILWGMESPIVQRANTLYLSL